MIDFINKKNNKYPLSFHIDVFLSHRVTGDVRKLLRGTSSVEKCALTRFLGNVSGGVEKTTSEGGT